MSTSATAHEVRGSQKLLSHLAKNGEVPSAEEIRKAFNLPSSVKIPNWQVRGTPIDYLVLEGTLEMPITQLGAVVDQVMKVNDSAIGLRILTNGIPIPDIAQVIIRNIPGER